MFKSFCLLIIFQLTYLNSLKSQVVSGDSIALISFLDANCGPCPLNNSNNPDFWNRNNPVGTWPGVIALANRVISLNVNNQSLQGYLQLGALDGLREIRFDSNQVDSLGPIGAMGQLIYLSGDYNQLHSLPSLNSQTNLGTLNCGHNLLDSLPSLDRLHNLLYLRINDNLNINQLPSLDSLVSLEELFCKKMNLSALPDLSRLHALITLFCDQNQLQNLPSLDSLPLLSTLGCSDNALKELPSLAHLNSLNTLFCSGNDLESLPTPPPSAPMNALYSDFNRLSFNFLEPYLSATSLRVFAPQNEIILSPKDSLLLPEESSALLDLDTRGGNAPHYKWFFDGILLPDDSLSYLPVQAYRGQGRYHCEFTNDSFPGLNLRTRPIHIALSDYINCDPNRNGFRDMLDLMPFGIHYGETGPERPEITLPSDTTNQLGYPWLDQNGFSRNFINTPDTINLKHVDTNGDGVINETDWGCIRQHYQALRNCQSQINQHPPLAFKIKAFPQNANITVDDEERIHIPFRLRLDALPDSYDSVKIRGAVFIRGEVEDSSYVVDSISAHFLGSDFAGDSVNVLRAMVFHPELVVDNIDYGELTCLTAQAKQLDIGMVRKDSARSMKEGDSFVVCEVLIDVKVNGSGNLPQEHLIAAVGDVNSIVLYIYDEASQEVVPVKASCEEDVVLLNVDSLLGRTGLLGQVISCIGDPVEGVHFQAMVDSTTYHHHSDAHGNFELLLPYGISVELSGHRHLKSTDLRAVDACDIALLKAYLFAGESLGEYQLIAADVNRDGAVDQDDLEVLTAFLAGEVTAFPLNGPWTLVNALEGRDPANPFPFSTTYTFPYTQRQYQQDFRAVLLGDVDCSWVENASASSHSCNQSTELFPSVPNPFSESTEFSFYLEGAESVQISIWDVQGRLIWERKGELDAGSHTWGWNGQGGFGGNAGSGCYWLRFEAGDYRASQRLLLIRE